MFTAALVVIGAVLVWLAIDRLLLRRDERLHRGHAAWSEIGENRSFQTTGWEETRPPAEAARAVKG
jgi:hypothetical protein